MNNILCIYHDFAYPERSHLMEPFRAGRIISIENQWSKSMSNNITSIEWIFGDIINYIKLINFKKRLKLQLSPILKNDHCLCYNARACLYG